MYAHAPSARTSSRGNPAPPAPAAAPLDPHTGHAGHASGVGHTGHAGHGAGSGHAGHELAGALEELGAPPEVVRLREVRVDAPVPDEVVELEAGANERTMLVLALGAVGASWRVCDVENVEGATVEVVRSGMSMPRSAARSASPSASSLLVSRGAPIAQYGQREPIARQYGHDQLLTGPS